MLRYRDSAGNVFSQTRNRLGQAETTSIVTATPSSEAQSPLSSADIDSDSSFSASTSGSVLSDSESEEEEVLSHLQRLQGLSGSWRRQVKRPRLAKDDRDLLDTGQTSTGLQSDDQNDDDVDDVPAEPEAAVMQVYVHGIDEAVLQSALTSSALWRRIQLNGQLEVRNS